MIDRISKSPMMGQYLSHLKNEKAILDNQGNVLVAPDENFAREIQQLFSIGLLQLLKDGRVKLSGSGMIAITTHYDPLTMRVTPRSPVTTDPNATVAWSGTLNPEFKTDISFKTFLGRGSGESVQMLFRGDGFVVIQPQEEVYLQAGGQ